MVSDLDGIKNTKGRGERTGIRILGKSEAFGPSCFAIVDESEVDNFAGCAEDVADLLL